MRTYQVKISGLSPLLLDRFTAEAEIGILEGTRAVKNSEVDPRQQVIHSAYRDNEDRLFVPGENIYRSLLGAGKFHKDGRKQVTTAKSSILCGCVFVTSEAAYLSRNGRVLTTKDIEIDTRSIVIMGGARQVKRRPRIELEWVATFDLEVDETTFKVSFIKQLLTDAGKRVGIGSFRPEKTGPFGRFVISGWEEVAN